MPRWGAGVLAAAGHRDRGAHHGDHSQQDHRPRSGQRTRLVDGVPNELGATLLGPLLLIGVTAIISLQKPLSARWFAVASVVLALVSMLARSRLDTLRPPLAPSVASRSFSTLSGSSRSASSCGAIPPSHCPAGSTRRGARHTRIGGAKDQSRSYRLILVFAKVRAGAQPGRRREPRAPISVLFETRAGAIEMLVTSIERYRADVRDRSRFCK